MRAGPAAGRVCGRREGGAPGVLPVERLAHDSVRWGRPGAVVHRVGWAGAGGRFACAFHEYCDFAHLQILVGRVQEVECRIRLTQPVHMPRRVWQGNPKSPLLYALLLEPLLRAQGHRLRPPGAFRYNSRWSSWLSFSDSGMLLEAGRARASGL